MTILDQFKAICLNKNFVSMTPYIWSNIKIAMDMWFMFMIFCIYVGVLAPKCLEGYKSEELVLRLLVTKVIILVCTFVFYFPEDFVREHTHNI
jgi:hypothetical protein